MTDEKRENFQAGNFCYEHTPSEVVAELQRCYGIINGQTEELARQKDTSGIVACMRLNSKLQAAFDAILGHEITERCAAQDAQWGGPEHDDTHSRVEWTQSFRKYILTAYSAADITTLPEISDELRWEEESKYESAMLDIAALAIQAIRSSRRKKIA